MKKISAVALNLLLFEELQIIVHTGSGEGEPRKSQVEGFRAGLLLTLWQEGSWWEGFKVVSLIKAQKLSRTWEPFQCGFGSFFKMPAGHMGRRAGFRDMAWV